jgi:hypothetical protein
MDFGYSIHSMKSRKLCERVARALPKKCAHCPPGPKWLGNNWNANSAAVIDNANFLVRGSAGTAN